MINIVTGSRNEGKSSKIKEIFAQKGENAWGFCSRKIKEAGNITGYKLRNMRTGEEYNLAQLSSLPLPDDWGESFNHGKFTFSKAGFRKAWTIFNEAEKNSAKSFFIDEVGKIELNGGGHAPLLYKALKSKMDLYIAIRDIYVEEASKIFNFGNFKIIDVD